jgi:hypothetical protein
MDGTFLAFCLQWPARDSHDGQLRHDRGERLPICHLPSRGIPSSRSDNRPTDSRGFFKDARSGASFFRKVRASVILAGERESI